MGRRGLIGRLTAPLRRRMCAIVTDDVDIRGMSQLMAFVVFSACFHGGVGCLAEHAESVRGSSGVKRTEQNGVD